MLDFKFAILVHRLKDLGNVSEVAVIGGARRLRLLLKM